MKLTIAHFCHPKTLSTLFLLLAGLFWNNPLRAQDLLWARHIGGTWDDEIFDITVDASGNQYIIGIFYVNTDLDPGPNVYELNPDSVWSIYISKLDPGGNLLWTKPIYANAYLYHYSIALDHEGNIYTSGAFADSVDFDPGPGHFVLHADGYFNNFILKLNPAGEFIWVKPIIPLINVTYQLDMEDLVVDSDQNIYLNGVFRSAIDFDPGPDTFMLESPNDKSHFLLKLDKDGLFENALLFSTNTSAQNLAGGMAIDNDDNIYLTGEYSGPIDFDPGPLTKILPYYGTGDAFILKLNKNLEYVWVKSFGSTGSDRITDLVLDASGNIITTGLFSGTVDFNPGPGLFNIFANNVSGFVQKLDPQGDFVWAKKFTGSGALFAQSSPEKIESDTEGNVYVTGLFNGVFDFDPGIPVYNLDNPTTSGEIFICKLTAAGDFAWAGSIGGTNHDYSTEIKVDADGNVFSVGVFKDEADFSLDPNIPAIVVGNGEYEGYIAKYQQPAVGVKNLAKTTTCSIAPNPTYGPLTLQNEVEAESISISVTDMMGHTVSSQVYKYADKINFELPDADGVYFVSINTGVDNPVIFKVLKAKP